MKIFITGVAGFLGANLANYFLKNGYQVSGNDSLIGGDLDNVNKNVLFYNLDCCDFEKMSEAIEGSDYLFHCAATAHEGLSVFSPNIITKNIFQASVSVFTASIKSKVKKIINCSSMARYGSIKPPFTEDLIPKPEDPYGIAKFASENVLKNLCDTHGTKYTTVVPHNIIGPFQKYDDPFRNVLSIMINRNLQGLPSIIYGDGMQERCFSYIDDVIFCLASLIDNNITDSEIINIGPDEEVVTINELANMVANVTGSNLEPIYFDARPNEVKKAICSSEKARNLLGYKTKTSLKEAIKKTYEYIKEKGPKEFKYHLPLEIVTDKTPKTWKEKLI